MADFDVICSEMSNIKVCITGSTGFVGAHLTCLLLKNGYSVRSLYRNKNKIKFFDSIHQYYELPKHLQPEWIEGDLNNTDELIALSENCELFFHCAAAVSFNKKDQNLLYQTNVIGTRNVVNTCLYNGIKKLLYVSSVAALGRSEETEIITENNVWVDSKYNSDYAVSKYNAELEVWRGKEEGLDVVVINPGIILGYGDKSSSAHQIYTTVQKKLPFYPAGSNGFVGVEDVAKMMLFLLDNNAWNQRYLCVSENISYEKLFKSLADKLHVPAPKRKLNAFTMVVLWKFFRFLETLNISTPVPSDTFLSSSKTNTYNTIHDDFLKDFVYFPIATVNHYALIKMGFTTE